MAAAGRIIVKKLGFGFFKVQFLPPSQSTVEELFGKLITLSIGLRKFTEFVSLHWGNGAPEPSNALQSCGIAAFYKCSPRRHLITVCNGHFLQWGLMGRNWRVECLFLNVFFDAFMCKSL